MIDLLTLLIQGDRRLRKIHQKVIILYGPAGSGKSCTSNWIRYLPMVGKNHGIQPIYANLNEGKDVAELSSRYTLKTLMPNTANLEHQTTLIDMTGYCKQHSYIGAVFMSYFLKCVFERAKQVKFLIVLNEHMLLQTSGEDIMNAFRIFLDIFNLQKFTPEIKDKFYPCISVVITRSKLPHYHRSYFDGVYSNFKNPYLQIDKKQQIIELMRRMIESNRFYAFQLAKENQQSPKCQMLQHFNIMNWQFLRINQIEENLGQTIINRHFDADYKLLSKKDKASFLHIAQQQLDSYKDFMSIIQQIIDTLKFNWIAGIQDMSVPCISEILIDQILSFERIFEHIESFLNKNGKYHASQCPHQRIYATYPSMSIRGIICSLLDIFKIVEKIEDCNGTFQECMDKYLKLFPALADCIISFCRSRSKQIKIQRVKFILQRMFRQISKFYQIALQEIFGLNQIIRQNCNIRIFRQNISVYLKSFFQLIKIEDLIQILPSMEEIEGYEQLYIRYKAKYTDLSNFVIFTEDRYLLNKHDINISIVKTKCYIKSNDRKKAGSILIRLMRLLWTQTARGGPLDCCSLPKHIIQEIGQTKIQIIDSIINIPKTLDFRRYPAAKDLGILLCKQTNQINTVYEIYALQLIDYKQDSAKLCEIYQRYVDYCIQWGQYEEASILLQDKLRLQTYNGADRINTINRLLFLADKSFSPCEQYVRRLERFKQIAESPGFFQTLENIQSLIFSNHDDDAV